MPELSLSSEDVHGLELTEHSQVLLSQLLANYPAAAEFEAFGQAKSWDGQTFTDAMQELNDLGLLQYEACVPGTQSQPRFAGTMLTYRGFKIAGEIAARDAGDKVS